MACRGSISDPSYATALIYVKNLKSTSTQIIYSLNGNDRNLSFNSYNFKTKRVGMK
jgi:hypothetical protein